MERTRPTTKRRRRRWWWWWFTLSRNLIKCRQSWHVSTVWCGVLEAYTYIPNGGWCFEHIQRPNIRKSFFLFFFGGAPKCESFDSGGKWHHVRHFVVGMECVDLHVRCICIWGVPYQIGKKKPFIPEIFINFLNTIRNLN